MAIVKTKKPFKLNVLGLFTLESEDWTFKEVALIMLIVMIFILGIITLLKLYAIPALGTNVVVNKISTGIQKIIKSRSP